MCTYARVLQPVLQHGGVATVATHMSRKWAGLQWVYMVPYQIPWLKFMAHGVYPCIVQCISQLNVNRSIATQDFSVYIWKSHLIIHVYTCTYVCIPPSGEPHFCPAPCHEGPCPPCEKSRRVHCRCGKSSVIVECGEVEEMGEFVCQRQCNKMKTCGRHRCTNRCCMVSCDIIAGKFGEH